MIPDFEIHKNALLKYRGHERKVIIPEGVEFITANAFNCCQTVTEVILPETLISIGDSAFGGCTYLQSIVIPENTNSLGTGIFTLCEHLENMIIPEGVTAIKAHAFDGCKRLKSVQLPSTLDSIGISAFHWCESLESIVIPDQVTEFGDKMFNSCVKLKNLTYRGITVNPNKYQYVDLSQLLTMIHDRDFSVNMPYHSKIDVIFKFLFADLEEEQARAFIEKDFQNIFQFLIYVNDLDLIREILDHTELITAENIDSMIRLAIDKRKLEIQVMLTEYKHTHIGYQSTSDIIQQKFAL